MAARIQNISFDAHDPYAQAVWWNQVLADYELGDEDQPGHDECGLESADGRSVLFLRVPESKTVKNRMHLCLTASDGGRDAEVDRIRSLGATVFDDRRTPDGRGWVVFLDPEGNEFCVVRDREQDPVAGS